MSGKSNYDGWTIAWTEDYPANLSVTFFSEERSEAIRKFEVVWGKRSFDKKRKKGHCKLVKVKLIEVTK